MQGYCYHSWINSIVLNYGYVGYLVNVGCQMVCHDWDLGYYCSTSCCSFAWCMLIHMSFSLDCYLLGDCSWRKSWNCLHWKMSYFRIGITMWGCWVLVFGIRSGIIFGPLCVIILFIYYCPSILYSIPSYNHQLQKSIIKIYPIFISPHRY